MKSFQKSLVLLSIFSFSLSKAEDLGFRFDEKREICVNDKGESGHNPDFMGPCGLLTNRDFKWANLTFTWDAMPGAILDDSVFYGAELTTLNLRWASLRNIDFTIADLSGADLRGATLTGSTFKNSFLAQANLSRANLSGIDLSDTSVRMADFSNADLRGTSFRANEGMHQAKFDGAMLDRANLQRAYLYGASFKKASLVEADFSHSQLLGADFTGAKVEGAKFREAAYNTNTILPFDRTEADRQGMRFISEPDGEGKEVAIQGNSDGTCSPKEIHLMRGEKVVFVLKGDPAIMFMLTIPDFQVDLMTMGADPAKKAYTPNQSGTFKFTCGPHGASDDRQTHGTIMVM